MTDNESSAVLDLLRDDMRQRKGRDSEFRELLGKNLSEIQSTRDDVQALSVRVELHEKDDSHTHAMLGGRLEHLEDRADATGQHELVRLQGELTKRDDTLSTWKGRVWSIFATFLTTATLALVAHYLATR